MAPFVLRPTLPALLLLAGAVIAFVAPVCAGASPELRDDCPIEIDDHGWSGDVRWVVGIATCPDLRTTFSMWIILPDGEGGVVYEADDGPIPLRWSRSGSVGRVHLTHPPAGETDPWVDVALDARGLPIAPVLLRDRRRPTP